MTYTLGIRREDKSEWERRTPIIPAHVKKLVDEHDVKVYVQPSEIRVFPEEEYKEAGAVIEESLNPSKVLFAVKEVPELLIEEGKTYVNFSHVIKGQPYNMPTLKIYMEKGCTLIDYEKITDENNRRLIFFGRHAGLAGMIDTLWALGKRLEYEGIESPFSGIQQTYHYANLAEAEKAVRHAGEFIKKEGIPRKLVPLVCGFAGYGNVSQGAQHILDLLPHIDITPEELLTLSERESLSDRHVYKVVFKEKDIAEPVKLGETFHLQDYYDNPGKYRGVFSRYVPHLTLLVNAVYWSSRYPRLVTRKLMNELYCNGRNKPPLRVIADISCDVEGAIELTTNITTPGDPVFVFDPVHGTTTPGFEGNGVVVLAVDILPSELPRESSEYFSEVLIKFIPALLQANQDVSFEECDFPPEIKRAVIVYKGELTPRYEYLKRYLR